MDEKDPGWRWEEIEASLPMIPDEKNGALRVAAVMAKLPPRWLDPKLDDELWNLKPTEQISEELRIRLAQALNNASPALQESQGFAKLSHGRRQLEWPTDRGFPDDIKLYDDRPVGYLLMFQAMLRAQENDLEGAWSSGQAAYDASRCLGQPHDLVSFQLRLALRSIGLTSLQRSLAQGAVSENSLAATQSTLEDDATLPLLREAFRGERAIAHRMYVSIEAGLLPNALADERGPHSWIEHLTNRNLYVPRVHAAYLRHITEVSEAAHRSPQPAMSLMDGNPSKWRNPRPGPKFVWNCDSAVSIYRRNQTRVHCAIIALAAERYRLQEGHWPNSLTDLSAAFLKQAPMDPYDGTPLSLLPLDDGILIFSSVLDSPTFVDGLNYTRNDSDRAVNFGFRLWNPEHRRQPPKPNAP